MNGLHRTSAALALLAISAGAAAQSTNTLSDSRIRENRVQAGIVIPFGSSGSEAERAPRLEMWSDLGRQRDGAEVRLQSDLDGVYGPPNRLGVALGQEPRLMVNGREVPGQGDRRNVSALGWVGITIGVAAVVVGAALLGVFGQNLVGS